MHKLKQCLRQLLAVPTSITYIHTYSLTYLITYLHFFRKIHLDLYGEGDSPYPASSWSLATQYPSLEPVAGEPLIFVTRGQCDARPTVTFPAARHHRPSSCSKLYCLVIEAHVCWQVSESGTRKFTGSCSAE